MLPMYNQAKQCHLGQARTSSSMPGDTVQFAYTGLKVNDQLVAHATRFFIVRLKNHVLSHVRA